MSWAGALLRDIGDMVRLDGPAAVLWTMLFVAWALVVVILVRVAFA